MTTTEFLASCLLMWNSAACSHSRGSKSNNSSIQRGEKGLLTARFFWRLRKGCVVTELGTSISNTMPNWIWMHGLCFQIRISIKYIGHTKSCWNTWRPKDGWIPFENTKTALDIGSSWWRQRGYIPWDHLVPFSAASFVWWFSCQFLDVEVM